jgi:hypothetical protein
MQGNSERKPKHRADGWDTPTDDYTERDGDTNSHGDTEPVCNCDPLTDGYANIDCNTHGIPVQPRQDPMGRGAGLL